MKKHLLLFVFVLAASTMRAQYNDMYSIMYHSQPGRAFVCEGLMQQHDGHFVINSYVYENDEGSFGDPLGNMFYKLSLPSLAFTDSLFVNDTSDFAHSCQFARHPNGAGNILTKFEYREDCDSCFLHISHFSDNDLNPVEDVVTPVCEGYAIGQVSLVDPRGDLIVQYQKIRNYRYDEYVARFGSDGTLKCQAQLSENVSSTTLSGQLHVLKESPLKYYQWGENGTYNQGWFNITVYALDSLFNRNPIVINSCLNEATHDYYYFNYDSEIIPTGGDDVLIGARYVHEVNPQNPLQDEYGVIVAKYDLRTMQMKGFITFDDHPNHYPDTRCLGLKMMTDGTVYFLYKETGYPHESFIAVKMDTNLNVEWKRFCKTDDIIVQTLQYPVIYIDDQGEEKGIAWLGEAARDEFQEIMDFVFFYFNHDGTVSVSDGGIEVRPYAFYPNPVQDQLHMQYSPDVQPVQVELYDLQGRLVRTQRSNFEHIDMGQLPAGTYTLRVIMEDGKSYSDKVVKE